MLWGGRLCQKANLLFPHFHKYLHYHLLSIYVPGTGLNKYFIYHHLVSVKICLNSGALEVEPEKGIRCGSLRARSSEKNLQSNEESGIWMERAEQFDLR